MPRYYKIDHNTQLTTCAEPKEDKPLEQKIQAMMNNEEPIVGTDELIFTKKRDGILPMYDPRGDRFDAAIEAINDITMSAIAKRKELSQLKDEETKPKAEPKVEPKVEPTAEQSGGNSGQ